MNKSELRAWLNIDESVNVQMPNEIFEDLSNAEFKNFNHKCFAYGYYYLITYLYRNTIYGTCNIEKYNQQNIISLFVSNNTMVSYITKKGGLLDKIGYTRTTTNYPVAYYMDNGILEFSYITDLRKRMPNLEINHSPRFMIKEPLKGLVRFDGEDCTGTFYDFQNTHRIDIQKFVDIIADEQLGSVGLYIYGYLSMMNDRFPMGYQISNTSFAEIVGCTDRTITKYTNRLEELGFIKSERKLLGYKLLEKIYKVV
jgi:hypothetical protein